jgi:tryptophan synthase alpha subunit
MSSPLTEAIRARRAAGRRAFGIYLVPGFPDWPASLAAVRAAVAAGVTFVEFPVIAEPVWSGRTGPVIAEALGRAVAQPDERARREWLAEIELGVAVVYESAWPSPGEWRIPDEGAAGLLLEHDVEDLAAYAKIAADHGTCLIPAVSAPDSARTGPALSGPERTAVALGEGFVYLAMGSRTGRLDARVPQVAAKAAAVTAERPELPVCCAFGLSTPEDVRRMPPECDGLIVGSEALRRLSHGQDEFRDWLAGMLAAT